MLASKDAVLSFLVAVGTIVSVVNGNPPQQIRGGGNYGLGEYPWVVAINTDSDCVPECGGAIISPRHVITAAHCVDDAYASHLTVRAGFTNLLDDNAVVRRVTRYYIHPDYKEEVEMPGPELMNDLAILVLRKSLPIDGHLINVIPLPPTQPSPQYAIFTGWGSTSEVLRGHTPVILQTTVVQLKNSNECKARMNSTTDMSQYLCGYVHNGNLMTGDSGSPLVSNGHLIGIASSGYGTRNSSDLYMNIYHYRDWITSIIDRVRSVDAQIL